MSSKKRAVLGLLFVMLAWGSSFTVTKMAVEELPPVYFAFIRFGIASVIMLLACFFNRKSIVPPSPVPHFHLVIMGLSGISIFYIFFNYSLKYTSASTGALLEGFIPVNIAILAAIFLKEKLLPGQFAGILLSVAGVILVGFVRVPPVNAPRPLLGNILMIICVFAWSVYTIVSKKVAHLNPVYVITYITVVGTIFLVPSMLFEMGGHNWPMPSAKAWIAALYLGAIASALCYFLYNKALESLTASQVGNFLNLDPVTGALIAIVFLGEKIVLLQVTGCLMVFTGVWLSARTKKNS
jgi:drug/metabolite transporter (DMT)-like permease